MLCIAMFLDWREINMQKREPPAYQEYPASILAERNYKLMTLAERGLLYSMRLECWVNGTLPSSLDELAKYLGFTTDQLSGALTDRVRHYFKESFGNFRSEELDNYKEHLEEQRRRKSEGGKNSAKNKKNKQLHNSSSLQVSYQDSANYLVKPRTVKTSQEQSLERGVIDDAWVNDYESAKSITDH
jgi:hypothetical protein